MHRISGEAREKRARAAEEERRARSRRERAPSHREGRVGTEPPEEEPPQRGEQRLGGIRAVAADPADVVRGAVAVAVGRDEAGEARAEPDILLVGGQPGGGPREGARDGEVEVEREASKPRERAEHAKLREERQCGRAQRRAVRRVAAKHQRQILQHKLCTRERPQSVTRQEASACVIHSCAVRSVAREGACLR